MAERIEKLLRAAALLYPKYHRKFISRKDIGDKCLEYFHHALPLHTIFVPHILWVKAFQNSLNLYDPPVYRKSTIQLIFDAMQEGERRIKQLRQNEPKNLLNAVRTLRAANCGELAPIAKQWLEHQGVNAHLIDFGFYKDGACEFDTHLAVMYARENKYSLNHMIHHLDDPDVRIVDLYFQKTAPAKEMIQLYAKEFSFHQKTGNPVLLKSGAQFGIEINKHVYFVGALDRDPKRPTKMKLNFYEALQPADWNKRQTPPQEIQKCFSIAAKKQIAREYE